MIKELRDSAEVAKHIKNIQKAEYMIAKAEHTIAENKYILYLAKLELKTKIEEDKKRGN